MIQRFKLKPEIQQQILDCNSLRIALMVLWNVREKAMVRSIKENSTRVFMPNSLAIISNQFGTEPSQLYYLNDDDNDLSELK